MASTFNVALGEFSDQTMEAALDVAARGVDRAPAAPRNGGSWAASIIGPALKRWSNLILRGVTVQAARAATIDLVRDCGDLDADELIEAHLLPTLDKLEVHLTDMTPIVIMTTHPMASHGSLRVLDDTCTVVARPGGRLAVLPRCAARTYQRFVGGRSGGVLAAGDDMAVLETALALWFSADDGPFMRPARALDAARALHADPDQKP